MDVKEQLIPLLQDFVETYADVLQQFETKEETGGLSLSEDMERDSYRIQHDKAKDLLSELVWISTGVVK